MNKILTTSQMISAEKAAAEYGLCEKTLIASASFALFLRVKDLSQKNSKIAVVCGNGNNGADGLSLARLLHLYGYSVTAYVFKSSDSDFFKALSAVNADIITINGNVSFQQYNIVVDCVFGIGLNKDVSGVYADVINAINNSRAYVLACDIPSGLDANTGLVRGCCVNANETVTFSAIKFGHLLGQGQNYCGNIIVADLGIKLPQSTANIVSDIDVLPLPRKKASHKSDYGKIKIIAGSSNYVGAAVLCAESASKAGAGLVTLCVAKSLTGAFTPRVLESSLEFLDDTDGQIIYNKSQVDKIIESSTNIAIGMGLTNVLETQKILAHILRGFNGTLVIDALGLDALKLDFDVLKNKKCNVILTPHMGEFNRLILDYNFKGEFLTPLEKAQEFAKEHNVVLCVKDSATVVTDGVQTYISTSGCAAMAKGGTGDVLAGKIVALSARLDAVKAAYTAAYVQGKKGELGQELYGSDGLLARSLI